MLLERIGEVGSSIYTPPPMCHRVGLVEQRQRATPERGDIPLLTLGLVCWTAAALRSPLACATASQAIEELLAAQIALRSNRRLDSAMRSSRLPAMKTLARFDFAFQASVKREQIESPRDLGLRRARRERAYSPIPSADARR